MTGVLPKTLALAGALVVLGLNAGCMKLGPDYQRPEPPAKIPAAYDQAANQSAIAIAQPDRWWEAFGDPELNRLVELAVARNLDLAKATARVQELQALFSQSRAERYPQISASGTGQRQRAKSMSLEQGGISVGAVETDSYNLAVAASYEVDLWGRLARLEQAARGDLLAAQETRRTVAQTVIASVVTSHLTIQTLERRLQVAQSSIEAYQRSMEFVEGRYRRGLTSELALRQARRALANAKAGLPSLRQDLGQAQQNLAVLVGAYPKVQPARAQPADYFKQLPAVPAGLPSELLLRRPDLRAAEHTLQALSARIGAAKAARFPTISLTAQGGYASDQLESLIRPDNALWNAALGLTAPLFDAGLRRAKQDAAQARYDQGVADWAKQVLTAFSEVEGALLTRREQLTRRELVQKALAEAVATQEAAQRRYMRGLSDYLDVLEAQYTRYNLEDQLVLTDYAILSNRVSLHRALGGGWDDISAAPAADGSNS
ncbi:RND efflux system, outer membrane lipoprotein, NodT family [Desulfarculus baarsii DSM 2075]|uniref:RND efflux system, outer membrane lipoprotein, NodT family n=1 Tax=Desulfarculus baarsii (strain ATCC 33931 / DSM 2075 / LMG 7858 / VKM B-1802 / 2st14) TaxID=644282 RepID=E1QJ02_DESB2|nr:efflux transporter outer membrane subunit [Desulfarculus baarsii]ADK85545.1 RND efflux system, outer membrane lipoprotein, NodT family [Desulfarculus baarsii DSM 2075]